MTDECPDVIFARRSLALQCASAVWQHKTAGGKVSKTVLITARAFERYLLLGTIEEPEAASPPTRPVLPWP